MGGANTFTVADYEEDAEGFQFSIMPSKKSRPSLEPVSEVQHSDVENAPPKSPPRRGRPPKKRLGEDSSANGVPVNGKTTELPRRPTRGSKAAETASEPQAENATRSLRNRDPPEDQPEEKKRKRGRPGRPKATEQNGFKSPEQAPVATKVALPAADTPVIQRNKELRGAKSDKGRRRSSLSRRGRRASDLIDSGASNGRFYPRRAPWRQANRHYQSSITPPRSQYSRFLQAHCGRWSSGAAKNAAASDLVCDACVGGETIGLTLGGSECSSSR